MSNYNVSNVAGVPLKDHIPESSKLVANQIPVQSVVLSRSTSKYVASNGSTFGPNQVINTIIQDNSKFCIPSTGCVHFKLVNKTQTTGGENSTDAAFDDLGTCVLNRAQLSIAGIQVEDILDVNKVINTKAYAHMSKAVYDHEAGNTLKTWKWNTGYDTVDLGYIESELTPDPSNVAINTQVNLITSSIKNILDQFRMDSAGVGQRQEQRARRVEHVDASTNIIPVEVNIPLSYIYASFRSNTLFPLAFIGQLKLDFILESAVKAIVSSTGTDVADYEIQDYYVTLDTVSLSDEYMKVMTMTFNSGEEYGYTLPINTFTTSTQTTIGGGSQDLTYSKSTPFLKSIQFRLSHIDWDNTISQYSISGQAYRLADNPNLRLTVGSEPFPQYDSLKSPSEVYKHNQVALGQFSNVADNVGLATAQTWKGTDSDNSHFYVLFSFEKINGLGTDYYAMDSFDASIAGGVVNLHGDYLANTRVLAIFEHTRLVKMGNRMVQVKG